MVEGTRLYLKCSFFCYNGCGDDMKEKKLTMKDIAKMAGVEKNTVSRYFKGVYVKDETKIKIKKIIDQYNYQPNTFVQNLKAKETKIIGVIAPTLTSTTSL